MRALSIRQPWAWLIAEAVKDIENRRWATTYRGVFLIHAGKQFDSEGHEGATRYTGVAVPSREDFETGGGGGIGGGPPCVTRPLSRRLVGPRRVADCPPSESLRV